jgi:hypothetical protein
MRGSLYVVVDCSIWLLMKLDKADLGSVLPMEFYRYYQQDQHQENQCSCHHCHAEFGDLSEYKYEISLSSMYAIQETRSHLISVFLCSFSSCAPCANKSTWLCRRAIALTCLNLRAGGHRRCSGQHRFRWLDRGLGDVAPPKDAASNIRSIGNNREDG